MMNSRHLKGFLLILGLSLVGVAQAGPNPFSKPSAAQPPATTQPGGANGLPGSVPNNGMPAPGAGSAALPPIIPPLPGGVGGMGGPAVGGEVTQDVEATRIGRVNGFYVYKAVEGKQYVFQSVKENKVRLNVIQSNKSSLSSSLAAAKNAVTNGAPTTK